MGSSSSKETSIQNETLFNSSMKAVNESINSMTMNIMQESMKSTAASVTVKQKIDLSGGVVGGDFVVSGIGQGAEVEVSLSSLTESSMKQELITNTMNELQSKLKESMDASQSQESSEGEQMVAALADAVSGVAGSMTGADSKESTNIKNSIEVNSEVEMVNKIENAVSADLINKTVENVALALNVDQEIDMSDKIVGGDMVVTDIKQETLAKAMMEAITKSSVGVEIISKVGNMNIVEVEKSIAAGQTLKSEEIGTIDAAGTAVSGVIGTALGGMMIPLMIAGGVVVVFLVIKGQSPGGLSKMGNTDGMMGGGKKLFSLVGLVSSSIKKLFKYNKKLLSLDNVIRAFAFYVIARFLYKLYKKNVENFESNTSKLLMFKEAGKERYVKRSGSKICSTDNKNLGNLFNLSFLKSEENTDIFLITKEDKYGEMTSYYIKFNDGLNRPELVKYNFANDSEYKITFSKSDDKYVINKGNKYIIMKNGGCAEFGAKEKATKFSFV